MEYIQDACVKCEHRMFKGWEYKKGSPHPQKEFLVCYNENCDRFKIRVYAKR